MHRRSLLFMPGNQPGMLFSADVLGADTVIFDLEDAVSPEEKDSARILVREALRSLDYAGTEIAVRINPTDTPWWREDLTEVISAKPDLIMIPKASADSVRAVESFIDSLYPAEPMSYLLLIETPMDLIRLTEICESSEHIAGIALGGEDYAVGLQVARTADSIELAYARMVIANTARAFGYDAIDTPFTDTEDETGLMKHLHYGKSIGMGGSLLIGPRQVSYTNRFFLPTKEEVEEAKAIVRLSEEARKQGKGVFSYRGKMVDAPVIKRAQQTVAAARRR